MLLFILLHEITGWLTACIFLKNSTFGVLTSLVDDDNIAYVWVNIYFFQITHLDFLSFSDIFHPLICSSSLSLQLRAFIWLGFLKRRA